MSWRTISSPPASPPIFQPSDIVDEGNGPADHGMTEPYERWNDGQPLEQSNSGENYTVQHSSNSGE
jgi:hypothetical protein